MSQEGKSDVFLSYNHGDEEWVTKFATSIESEQYDNRNLKVFLDDWDIVPGKNMVQAMEDGLKNSRYVCPILSKNSIDAEWPNMEWSIAISSDPSGRHGRIIPIWLGNCDIPPSLKIRNVLYCNDEISFKKSYSKLIAVLKNEKLPRGTKNNSVLERTTNCSEQFSFQYHDEFEEQLASNLFPVTHLPEYIWNGPVGSLTHREVFEHLKKTIKGVHPTFLIREKRIYSFWDLNHYNCPFKELLNASDIQKETTKSWISDPIKNSWLIELFNRALKGHCWDLNLRYDKDHGRFFFPPLGGTNRTETWHTGKRKSTRQITTKHTKGKTEQVFWSHQSLRAKFMNISDDIFLQLEPAWAFTFDGEHPLTGKDVGVFSTKWTTKERNPSVFYHVRFWSSLLSHSKDSISIRLGNEKIVVDVTPAVITLPVGIEGDFNPIEKVFETADKEIESTETERIDMLQDDELNG